MQMNVLARLAQVCAKYAEQGMTPGVITSFRTLVHAYSRAHGRTYLPWRKPSATPYHILVSEIMLQQTQVDRVIEKYLRFLALFPTPELLASATQAEVITAWSGLGYNRRGLNLKRAAEQIVQMHGGEVPRETLDLIALPGVGPYTAAAVRAFAFGIPGAVIETNIRAVYLYLFFPGREQVPDSELLPLIERTMDSRHPREWYGALMDLGSWLKLQVPNPSRGSRHHARQSTFQGSLRQVRGAALRLAQKGAFGVKDLAAEFPGRAEQAKTALQQLTQEGFLTLARGKYSLK